MLTAIGIIYLVATLAVLGLGITIFVQARNAGDFGEIKAKAATLRKLLFMLVLVLFGVAVSKSLPNLPYAEFVEARGDKPEFVVSVIGQDWSWILSTDRVPVGVPIEFRVTSIDVNHGFGVYDDTNSLVGQIQSMPGYINRLIIRIKKPGTYRVLCMEYCGVGHHNMLTQFKAVSKESILPKILPDGWPSGPEGMKVAFNAGCLSCHTTRGSKRDGLSWKGLYKSQRNFSDGSRTTADTKYLAKSILNHDDTTIEGFIPGLVGSYEDKLTTSEVNKLVSYIKSLK